MSDRQQYMDKMQKQLEAWNQDIERFEEKAKTGSAELKKEIQSQILTLKKKRDEAVHKMEELQKETDSAWDDVKHGCEEAWHSISHALSTAKAKLFDKEATK